MKVKRNDVHPRATGNQPKFNRVSPTNNNYAEKILRAIAPVLFLTDSSRA